MVSDNPSVKPCDEPCPTCGSVDIHRQYRRRESTWQCEFGGYKSRYARLSPVTSYIMYATRDHLENHCRTCQRDWQVLPLPKPSKAKVTT